MKTYIADIIPKIQRFSQKLDNLTLLTNQHWVLIDEIDQAKTVYIFRTSGELLISRNGKVEKAKWEYLGNKSLLIDTQESSYLFKHSFFDENVIALKLDSREEYALMVNENRYEGEINSLEKMIDFLTMHYLESPQKQQISEATGIEIKKTVVVEDDPKIQEEKRIKYEQERKEDEKITRIIFYGTISMLGFGLLAALIASFNR